MKPLYFVNSGVNPSHIKIQTKIFSLLREAKKYALSLDTTEYRSQCWELIRVSNYKQFTDGKENLKITKLDYKYTEFGKILTNLSK